MGVTKRFVTQDDVGHNPCTSDVKNALLYLMEHDKGVNAGYVTRWCGENGQSILLEVHGKTTADQIVAKLIAEKGILWHDTE